MPNAWHLLQMRTCTLAYQRMQCPWLKRAVNTHKNSKSIHAFDICVIFIDVFIAYSFQVLDPEAMEHTDDIFLFSPLFCVKKLGHISYFNYDLNYVCIYYYYNNIYVWEKRMTAVANTAILTLYYIKIVFSDDIIPSLSVCFHLIYNFHLVFYC